MDDGDGDARASSSSPSSAGTFSVLARRVDGADVGPVTIEASDGTVRALKRALYDAPWRPRARDGDDGGGGGGETGGAGEPSRVGERSRRRAGFEIAARARDGGGREDAGGARGGERAEVAERDAGAGVRGEKGDASRGRSPQCCSVM